MVLDEVVEADVQPPCAPLPAQPQRILVVDDNRDSAKSLAMLLKLIGNETFVAHDGVEALEVAEHMRPDVVLLDIGLPKMNGRDVCRVMRSKSWGYKISIVAMTGWGQEGDRRKSTDAGFDHHLVKPVGLAVLASVLAECGARSNDRAERQFDLAETAAKGPQG
jgi:CheY-like chemotaxis protein